MAPIGTTWLIISAEQVFTYVCITSPFVTTSSVTNWWKGNCCSSQRPGEAAGRLKLNPLVSKNISKRCWFIFPPAAGYWTWNERPVRSSPVQSSHAAGFVRWSQVSQQEAEWSDWSEWGVQCSCRGLMSNWEQQQRWWWRSPSSHSPCRCIRFHPTCRSLAAEV